MTSGNEHLVHHENVHSANQTNSALITAGITKAPFSLSISLFADAMTTSGPLERESGSWSQWLDWAKKKQKNMSKKVSIPQGQEEQDKEIIYTKIFRG